MILNGQLKSDLLQHGIRPTSTFSLPCTSPAIAAIPVIPAMFIDFKLPPEKPVIRATKAHQWSTLACWCGSTILVVILAIFLLLSGTLLSLTSTSLHSLHTALLTQFHSPPSLRPFSFDLVLHDDRPRWTNDRLARRLPQCIIIGVRKSGTRALLEFLSLHPRIRKASDEVHFFDEEQNYQHGLEWYRRQMPFSYSDQITIEKSPAYFITRYVPERVRAMNASVRLIVVVKDPITRVVSDYTQTRIKRVKKGKKFLSFEDTVLTPDGSVDVSYKPIRVSLYHKHLLHWLKVFPRQQILIVNGDTLVQDPVEEMVKVERFLGLDHRIDREHFHFNTTKGFYCIRDEGRQGEADRCLSKTKGRQHPTVPEEVLQKLRDFFRPHNQRFFEEIGTVFDW